MLYRLPNIVRVIKARNLIWAGHVCRTEEDRSAFKMLKGKPTKKRSLGRSRRRWHDDIIIDLREIGIKTRNWADSVQDRDYLGAYVNAALRLRVL